MMSAMPQGILQGTTHRLNPPLWIWYTFGGRLGPRYREWVPRDVTCRTLLAAPDGASGGTDRGARGRGVGGSDGAGFGLVVFGGVACGALLGLWYSLAYIDQTGDRRLVKHGYEPGTLKRELRERYDREHAEQIVRYRQTYRKAAD